MPVICNTFGLVCKVSCFSELQIEVLGVLDRDPRTLTMQALDSFIYDLEFIYVKGDSTLFDAAGEDNVAIVRDLVGQGIDLNQTDREGNTVLHYAAKTDKGSKALKYLLKQHVVDVNAQNKYGITPLLQATLCESEKNVKLLIRHGADVDRSAWRHFTPLVFSVYLGNYGLVKQLVEANCSVNTKEKAYGKTPLMLAADVGELGIVELLLAAGADITVTGPEGMTALAYATKNGSGDIVRELLKLDPSIWWENSDGETLLDLVSRTNDEELIREFVHAGHRVDALDKNGYSPLHTAAMCGNMLAFKELLKHGADLHRRSALGSTVLHIAVLTDKTKIAQLAIEEGVDAAIEDDEGNPAAFDVSSSKMIRVFKPKDLEAVNSVGLNLVCHLAMKGELDLLQYLRSIGIDEEASDKEGLTPLHLASLYGHENVVRFLLERVFPSPVDCAGFVPLDFSIDKDYTGVSKALITALVERSLTSDLYAIRRDAGESSIWAACALGRIDTVKAMVDADKACLEHKMQGGLTPLACGIKHKQLALCQELLHLGANISTITDEGNTMLHLAAAEGWEDGIRLFHHLGLQIDASNDRHKTPLGEAVMHGTTSAARLLLDLGAKPSNVEGAAPSLILAAMSNNLEILRLLLSVGAIQEETSPHVPGYSLHWAARNGNVDMTKDLVAHSPSLIDALYVPAGGASITPLSFAIQKKHQSTACLLVRMGAALDRPDTLGNLPLHEAAIHGLLELTKEILDRLPEVDALDARGRSPLWLAAFKGHTALSEFLLRKGANKDQEPPSKLTPIMVAAKNGHEDIVELLLRNEADVTRSFTANVKLLHMAARQFSPALVRLILDFGGMETLNSLTELSETPLHWACAKGSFDNARLLVGRGADVTIMDGFGRSCMDWARHSSPFFDGTMFNIEDEATIPKEISERVLDSTIRRVLPSVRADTKDFYHRHILSTALFISGDYALGAKGFRQVDASEHEVICDRCNSHLIRKQSRFRCTSCADFDLCETCYHEINEQRLAKRSLLESKETNPMLFHVEIHAFFEIKLEVDDGTWLDAVEREYVED